MKVYELIAELMKLCAGDEVVVQVSHCSDAAITSVEQPDRGTVAITCESPMIVDEDGNELGTTEDFAAQAEPVAE